MLRRRRALDGIDEDIRDHIERETAEYMARGMTPEEARRRALLAFGNVARVKEDTRAVWVSRGLDELRNDLRFVRRALCRSPLTTVIAILSLALGIGANTAIFSMMDAVMWKRLPVADPDQLVQLRAVDRTTAREIGIPAALLRELRQQRKVFDGPVFDAWDGAALRHGASAERVIVEVVTADYFSVLGVEPFLGTYFAEANHGSGWAPVAVLSYDFFSGRLQADPTVLGRTLYLNGYPFEVVGVSPPGFHGVNIGQAPHIRIPMMLEPGMQARVVPTMRLLDQSGSTVMRPVARLRPGVTREQAEAAVQVSLNHVWNSAGQAATARIALLDGARGRLHAPAWLHRVLAMTLAGTLLVLLIACANIANLLISRGIARRRELGVQLALGATRWRLMRQLAVESFVLAAGGAMLGLLIAAWGAALLLQWLPQGSTALVLAVSLDMRVLAFTAAIGVLAALLVGMAPAIRASRADPLASLKAGQVGHDVRGPLWLTGRGIVVVQLTLTPMLLVGAGLLSRSLYSVRAAAPDHSVLMFSMKHVRDGGVLYTEHQIRQFFRQLVQDVASVPGITGACVTGSGEAVAVPGTAVLHGSGATAIETDAGTRAHVDLVTDDVSPAFFSMFALQPLIGRVLTDADDDRAPKVSVITDALARDLWGAAPPVGRRFRLASGAGAPEYEVVGVVPGTSYQTPYRSDARVALFPLAQAQVPVMATLVVRVRQPAPEVVAEVRRVVAALDPNLPVFNIRTAAMQRDRDLARERLAASLFQSFGSLALLLTGIGLYGVIAYDVTRRRREIAIRLALGAEPHRLIRTIVSDALRLVLIGSVIGLVLASTAFSVLASELHGLPPYDPLVLVGALLTLVIVGTVAGWLPARRAVKVNPGACLHTE